MPSKHDFHKAIIGRSEPLTFVGLGLNDVPAKADTGAYRSAVHASDISLDEATGILSFRLLADHPLVDGEAVLIRTEDFQRVVVENSFGHAEERFQVKLKVKLGHRSFVSNFTLANRAKKLFPILLGRKLINHRFLVDPSKTSLDRAVLRSKYGLELPDDDIDDSRVPESQTVADVARYREQL
jgi:hypothetical protein